MARPADSGDSASGAAREAAGLGMRNTRGYPDASFDTQSVTDMKKAWSSRTDDPVSHTPLIEEGSVYFGDWGGNVYRVSLVDGKVVWKAGVEKPKREWPWHGFAGTGTLAEGKLFEASVEGNVFALDTANGKVLWQAHVADDSEAGVLSPLLASGGRIFLGLESVEEPMTEKKKGFKPDFRGEVMALDAATGKVAWRTSLVDAPATSKSDALIAVDAGKGDIKWVKQVFTDDVWTKADPIGPDYDFAGGAQLFEARMGGNSKPLVGAASKSGLYFAVDRENGSQVWQATVGYGGVEGGMHGEAAIGNGRMFVWSNNGYSHEKNPAEHPVTVKALDPGSGKEIWFRKGPQPAAMTSGVLYGDVYFLGSLDGSLQGYDAKDGRTVWTGKAQGPVTASLAMSDGRLLVGTGNPKLFGKWSKGKNGIEMFLAKGAVRQAAASPAE